jgi:phage FluMu gp28-like protein
MAYSKKQKDEAKRLFRSGVPISEISISMKITRRTLSNWKEKYHWETVDDSTIAQIETKINEIAAGMRNDSIPKQARIMDQLTRSLHRLNSAQKKRKKITPLEKKPAVPIEVIGDLEDKIKDALFPYQRDWVFDSSRFRIALKSRQVGFSYAVAAEMIYHGLKRQTDQILCSASQRQAEIVRNYVLKWAEALEIDLFPDGQNLICPGGAALKFLPSNFRTIQGNSGDLYLDEFAWHIKPDRLYAAAYPTITIGDRRLSICSAPYTTNDMFGKIFLDEQQYKIFSRHQIDIFQAKQDGLPVDIETIQQGIDKETFEMLYLCKFFSDEMAIFRVDDVQEALSDDCLFHTDRPVNGGMDIGRHKDLSEVVFSEHCPDQDTVFTRFMMTMEKTPYETQAATVKQLLKYEWNAERFFVDRTGIGDPVYEALLKEFPASVIGVWITMEWKAKFVLGVMNLFEKRKIKIPNDSALVAQLHSLKRKPTEKGFSYDSDRNERIKHADKAWALLMSVFEFGLAERSVVEADDVVVF